jgi:DNA-binding GntR family transcriptional regulator
MPNTSTTPKCGGSTPSCMATEEHRAVMDAIEARDAERAREATWVLLGNASDDLVRIRGKDPFRKS